MQGRRGDRLGAGDREPRRDARALVDGIRFAKVAREAREDLEEVRGNLGDEVGFLADDGDLLVDRLGVVRADLGAEAVLQRRDDAAAVRVVLGVGGGDDEHVEVEAQHVAPDLDVALLHDVEERDLDALGQVGQLVDRDDAAVAARHEPVVDRLGVAERAALGHLDRIDVADQVGDRRVGGGELLGVPLAAVAPHDGQVVAQLAGTADGCRRDGMERMLAEFRPLDDRRPFVQQPVQAAQQARLALAAFAEQHDVVAREDRAFELRNHGVIEAVDAGPRVASLGERREEVLAQLDPYRTVGVTRCAQLTGRGDPGRRWCHARRLRRLHGGEGRIGEFPRLGCRVATCRLPGQGMCQNSVPSPYMFQIHHH